MDDKEFYDLVTLVKLGEDLQLKKDLNKAVAELKFATESCFRPHLCLNGKEGIEVIEQVSKHPETANTEFSIHKRLIESSGDIWLNVSFYVYLGKISSDSVARLSPRQTAYIVRSLPPESKMAALGKIKKWYKEIFLDRIAKGLETITDQFENGDPFMENERRNRIFDIHGGRSGLEVPYVEWEIVGDKLFSLFFFSLGCYDQKGDSYGNMDALIDDIDMKRNTINGLIRLFHLLRDRERM